MPFPFFVPNPTCPACKRPVKPDFLYCPYCGNLLKSRNAELPEEGDSTEHEIELLREEDIKDDILEIPDMTEKPPVDGSDDPDSINEPVFPDFSDQDI